MIWQSPTRQTLCSRCVSVKWQTVSKAADRSRPISTKSAVRRKPVRKLRYVGRHRGRRGCLTGPSSTSSFHHHVCVVLLSFHICPELIPSLSLSSVVSDHFHTFILLPLTVHLYSSHVFFSFSFHTRMCVYRSSYANFLLL